MVWFFAAGVDYASLNRLLHFSPGEIARSLVVRIIDDIFLPRLEGRESFELVLQSPVDGVLMNPNKTVIYIEDSGSDGWIISQLQLF